MKVAVTGSTGLVGSALVPALEAAGHAVSRLVRKTGERPTEIQWDPGSGSIDRGKLEGHDAVVHLAGESIASGRWTAAKKARIRDSRVQGTKLLASTLAGLERRPAVLVSASAVGYYGDRGDQVLRESDAPGQLFLSDVCKEWEDATESARAAGIRVVRLRFGVILSGEGGALKQMLLPFKMGVGGILGSGKQYFSWIDLQDVVSIILFVLSNDSSGPYNVVAPTPVTNHEFTKTLGRVLSRPTIFPMPAFAARLVFGEMADELLLASTRVVPERLEQQGYRFKYAQLESSLRHQLGR